MSQNWFQQRNTSTANYLDPNEVQMMCTVSGVIDTEESITDYQYIPFAFGAAQSIFQSQDKKERPYEIFVELASMTQFEWKVVDGQQQRNLINTDYKIAFSWAKIYEKSTFRLRFFHVSSHLGDDYIFRSRINSHTENKVNYEQLEFSLFQNWSNYKRGGATVGSVIRPNAKRKALSSNLFFENSLFKTSNWGFTYGGLLKVVQETDFNPNIKLAAGLAYKRDEYQPLRIVFEYYKGQLPYSQYEKNEIEWLGMGMYFYIH